jgi:hypothetical protein
MDDFAALHPLQAPGTMVYGYRTGDPVPESVVSAWELEVGLDVRPLHTGAVRRPEDDSREAWEAYAIGQGMSYDDAQSASLADLKKTPEPEVDSETGGPVLLDDPDAPPARPEPTAVKADWVTYVIAMGADRAWAEDRSTTKADLQDWEPKRDFPASGETQIVPPSTDTVATSATQAQADANAQDA